MKPPGGVEAAKAETSLKVFGRQTPPVIEASRVVPLRDLDVEKHRKGLVKIVKISIYCIYH